MIIIGNTNRNNLSNRILTSSDCNDLYQSILSAYCLFVAKNSYSQTFSRVFFSLLIILTVIWSWLSKRYLLVLGTWTKKLWSIILTILFLINHKSQLYGQLGFWIDIISFSFKIGIFANTRVQLKYQLFFFLGSTFLDTSICKQVKRYSIRYTKARLLCTKSC